MGLSEADAAELARLKVAYREAAIKEIDAVLNVITNNRPQLGAILKQHAQACGDAAGDRFQQLLVFASNVLGFEVGINLPSGIVDEAAGVLDQAHGTEGPSETGAVG